jgi:hypothetical protein
MTQNARKVADEIRQGLFTPFVMGLAVIGLVLAAQREFQWFEFQTQAIVIFAFLCLVVFHFVAWACRRKTNDKSLKFVELSYLVIAFTGILGVTQLRSEAILSEIHFRMQIGADTLPQHNLCKPDPNGYQCQDEIAMLELLKNKSDDLSRIRELFERHMKDMENTKFWGFIGLHINSLMTLAVRYHDTKDSFSIDKLLGFYLLCIGLALRLTKTSVEIFEWYVPKISLGTTFLPTEKSDVHNTA